MPLLFGVFLGFPYPNILRTLEDRATCSFRAATVPNYLQLVLPSPNMAYDKGPMLQSLAGLLDCPALWRSCLEHLNVL